MLKKTLFALCLYLLCTIPGEAAIYYASPTGSGSACSSGSPCSITTLFATLAAGDTGRLKNGTYNLPHTGLSYQIRLTNGGTVGSPIIIESENFQQAIITSDESRGNGSSIVQINKSYVTFRGINITGVTSGGSCIKLGSTTKIAGSIVEKNLFNHCGGGFVVIQGITSGAIVRWNNGNGAGFNPTAAMGSAFYVASDSLNSVNDLQIYANRVNDFTQNLVDYKDQSNNVNAHHNLFENHVNIADHGQTGGANDGCVTSFTSTTATGNVFNDNIVRDSKCNSGVFNLNTNRVDADSNVFHDITDGNNYFRGQGLTSNKAQYSNNVNCNTPTGYYTSPASADDFQETNSTFGAAQATCDTEVTRILGEMQALSGNPQSTESGPSIASATTVDSTHIDLTFTNNNFPPVKAPDYTKCTVTENAASRAVSAGAIQGTNVLRLTVATLSGGTTILATCTAGAVTDSANILNQDWNINSSAFTDQAVTNTIGGSPSYTFEQVEQRFEKLDGTEAAPVSLGSAPTAEKGASFKIRTWLRCNTADCPSLGATLKYSLDGGGYTTAPDAAGADDIQFYGTTNTHGSVPSQGTATTQQISSGSYIAGSVIRTSNAIPTFDLGLGESIELVHIVTILTTATVPSQYCFRLADQAGIEAVTYTQSRCMTIGEFQSGR